MDLHTKVDNDNVTGGVVGEAEENKDILMSVKQVKEERERKASICKVSVDDPIIVDGIKDGDGIVQNSKPS